MSFGHRRGKRPASSGALAAPTTVGTLAAWVIFENSGNQTYDAAAGFAGTSITYSLTAGATGVSIDPGSGVITADTAVATIQTGTTLTVHAANGAGSADQNLSFTVGTVSRRRPVTRSGAAVYRAANW